MLEAKMFPYDYYWRGGVRYFKTQTGKELKASLQKVESGDQLERAEPTKTVSRPYYIGNPEMVGLREQGRPACDGLPGNAKPRYTSRTVQEAIKDAERRLADNPRLTEVSIVKIVRVVRRAKPVVAIDIEEVE